MASLLITGGTGSLGTALTRYLLTTDVQRLVLLSRDEYKQSQMAAAFPDPRLRFFLGDVRDEPRLVEACRGIEGIIHAAALKRVDKVAYDPEEVKKTNVDGTANVLRAARHAGVGRVVVVSSDKACQPTNVYGATKLLAEYLAIYANASGYPAGTRSSVVRYGNVLGSRGSLLEIFGQQYDATGGLLLTHPLCTRFLMRMEEAVAFVLGALRDSKGGEIFVPRLPAFTVPSFALAYVRTRGERMGMANLSGLRPGGEKLHERLLTPEEVGRTVQIDASRYVVRPALQPWGGETWDGTPVPADWRYTSDRTPPLSVAELTAILQEEGR